MRCGVTNRVPVRTAHWEESRHRVFGGVLEPSQEVEWLSKFSAVMQTSRYGRQVFHTYSNVPRLLLEDGSAFILR